jgi:hypothetical protein
MKNLSTTETKLSPSEELVHSVLLAMNEYAHRRHSEATKAGIRASRERRAQRGVEVVAESDELTLTRSL